MRSLEPDEVRLIARGLSTRSNRVDIEIVGPRTSLVLRRRKAVVGRVDFAYYPYDPIARRGVWRGLAVESLMDMTVNKVQAILTRLQPRDFVDLYFLLREGPERDLRRLLDFTRAKFDVGAHPMGLAARLLLIHEFRELPRLLRSVSIPELVEFFEARARELAAPSVPKKKKR